MNYAACLVFSVALVGCSFAPPQVDQHEIAPVGNHFDAGIIRWTYNAHGERTGVLVRQEYVDDYKWLISQEGAKLKPPLATPDGLTKDGRYWIIDLEHAGLYADMVQLENNP